MFNMRLCLYHTHIYNKIMNFKQCVHIKLQSYDTIAGGAGDSHMYLFHVLLLKTTLTKFLETSLGLNPVMSLNQAVGESVGK